MDDIMKYEDRIRKICGEDWNRINQQELEGGYGVACLIAYMRGVKPNLIEIAKHLNVPANEISTPFNRLMHSGAFDKDGWNAKEDNGLLGNSGDEEAHRNWAFVAAVAGGFVRSMRP